MGQARSTAGRQGHHPGTAVITAGDVARAGVGNKTQHILVDGEAGADRDGGRAQRGVVGVIHHDAAVNGCGTGVFRVQQGRCAIEHRGIIDSGDVDGGVDGGGIAAAVVDHIAHGSRRCAGVVRCVVVSHGAQGSLPLRQRGTGTGRRECQHPCAVIISGGDVAHGVAVVGKTQCILA